jgi:hypothetical protein
MVTMSDLIFVAALFAFFALAALFVKACDLIIGPDEEALAQRVTETLDPEPDGGRLAA